MNVADELLRIADRLEDHSKVLLQGDFNEPLELLHNAAQRAGRAWSGSWLGYHSRIYYEDMASPPPGARFSQEWGFMDSYVIRATVGDWREYRFDDVVSIIEADCGNPDISKQEKASAETKECYEEMHSQILSLLLTFLEQKPDDKFLIDISAKVKKMTIYDATDLIRVIRPSGSVISRDMQAIQEGSQTPPHLSVIARVDAILFPFRACQELSKLARRAGSHMKIIEKHMVQSQRIGTNIFIGHGRSSIWKDLKDFIQDRMHLPWDEFNRVPVAGVTNIARLCQMLDEAAIAFLIMTAEDEQVDGKQHARQNVVHEAGLFQGRLGFQRSIILLEEGCEEFSNVNGLGQIRFPKGNIGAAFEDIRMVLEREGLVNT